MTAERLMPDGPRPRSDRVKQEEAERVAKGEAALALPPGDRSAAIVELVAEESKAFLERRLQKIRRLKLTDLNLNFFLLRLVKDIHELTTPRAVIGYLTDATLRAGEETAYGWLVDLFLPPLLGAKTPPEREHPVQWQAFKEIDKEATRPNPATGQVKRHLISIKGGPLTINDTMARQMHENVRGFVTYGNDPVVYAVTYGRKEQLSNKPSIVKGDYSDDDVAILVGREFWDWLGQYQNVHVDIFNGIAEGERRFTEEHAGKPIHAILADKKQELTEAFMEEFRIRPEDDMWERLLTTGF
jgi:hypothetical protein